MQKAPFSTWALILTLFTAVSITSTKAMAETFPSYDTIQPNVSFWIKAYSKYTTRQAVVHDSRNLNIIYDVIELKPYDAYGARKINRRRMKNARIKYRRILQHLAAYPNTKKPSARKVAKLFGPKASAASFRLASKRIRCQIGQSDRFRAGLIRSGAYIDRIREIFIAEGLPIELAYLPHVESSFNYKAYSKFGAAGIWQFTRSTGKRFMKVGYVLDERRDPIIATHSAAALLKENYKKLRSWPLAITAYNHGASGMARAKRKYKDYPTIFKRYRSRSFKFASRNFYSEFLAAIHVATNYRTYFGELPLDRPLPIKVVKLEGYASLSDICEYYGVSVDTAKSLNPALRPPVYSGQKFIPKGYAFRLPADLEMASANLSTMPPKLYKSRQKPSRFYTVQRGDTAGRIARTHGVKLTDLIMANNLSRRATIYPRQTLRIPLPGEPVPAKPSPPSKTTKSVLVAGIDAPKSADRTKKKAAKQKVYPKVMLASVIPTSIAKVKPAPVFEKAPPLDAQIPSAEVVSVDVRFESVNKHRKPVTGTLQVEVEETLGHFAEWAGVRTQQIRRLNRLPYGEKLHLHQKVKIPLDRVSAQGFEEKRYEFHKRLQEDFFAVYRIGAMRSYRVKRGDNLWTLGLAKFDIPMWLLKNCNPEIDFAALRMQQRLLVPTIEKHPADSSQIDPEPDVEQMEVQTFPNSVL